MGPCALDSMRISTTMSAFGLLYPVFRHESRMLLTRMFVRFTSSSVGLGHISVLLSHTPVFRVCAPRDEDRRRYRK